MDKHMKITVKTTTNILEFSKLDIGQVFTLDGINYLKTADVVGNRQTNAHAIGSDQIATVFAHVEVTHASSINITY
ncbi:MAG: hypothetical protein HRU18_02810 [Pseudoalteromonas sp.]|uniref:hypothetical protein n=1 Tax=Pseudoalteromonas sp. TaxID=53249 RepID=UPI001D8C4263|nr:hypothetical protein [Pseudoalteromonas sp.]NRA77115.1 hypothetical protein [Pseudoalteromonas sp.]